MCRQDCSKLPYLAGVFQALGEKKGRTAELQVCPKALGVLVLVTPPFGALILSTL